MRHTTEIVLNRRAGGTKPGGKYAELGDRARLLGIPVWEPDTLRELDGVAAEILRRSPGSVVIVGGDGTLRDVVSALHRAGGGSELPALLFLPAGTVSTVVRNQSGRRSRLDGILEAVLRGGRPTTREQPTLLIELSGGRSLVGFIVGLGLVTRFFQEYQRQGSRGLGSAAKIAARVFAGAFTHSTFTASMLAPVPCAVVTDGATLSAQEYSLLTCAVVRDLGLHFIVNHRAGEDHRRPHLVACPLPAFALGRQALRVLRGQSLPDAGGYDGLITRGEIRFDTVAPVVIDGDLYFTESVGITAGPVLRVYN